MVSSVHQSHYFWTASLPFAGLFTVRAAFVVFVTFATFSFLPSSLFFGTAFPRVSSSSFSDLEGTFLSLCLPLMGAENVSEDLINSRGKMPTSPSKRFLVICRDLRPGHVTSFFSCRMRTLSASWLAWEGLKVKMCVRYTRHCNCKFETVQFTIN